VIPKSIIAAADETLYVAVSISYSTYAALRSFSGNIATEFVGPKTGGLEDHMRNHLSSKKQEIELRALGSA
jgi:hypothetical protein